MTGIGALLKAKLDDMPEPSQAALDAAARAMEFTNLSRARYVSLVRSQDPDEIIKKMTVFQARELYDRLKQIFNA